MIHRKIMAGVAAASLASAAHAGNGRIEVTWTGTIADVSNTWVLLGQRAQDYAGAGFDARIIFDPSRGFTPQPGWVYGGQQNGDTNPVLSDSISFGGLTFEYSGGYFGQIYTEETSGQSAFQTIVDNSDPTQPNFTALTLETVDPGDFGYGAPSFGPWDGDVTGAGANGGLFYFTDDQGNSGSFDLHVTHLTIRVLAAPEPASWAMMVAGFGLAGITLRRRTKTVSRLT